MAQVGRLKEAATEALKNKEDTEIKCQHKISDMVALMDKHKVDGFLGRIWHMTIQARLINV